MEKERRLEFRVEGSGQYLIQIMGSAEFVLEQLLSLDHLIRGLDKKPLVLDRSIEELKFSVRTYNRLKENNLLTLGDIVAKTEDEVIRIKNFGKKSLRELKVELAKIGLTLKDGGVNGHQAEETGSGNGASANLG